MCWGDTLLASSRYRRTYLSRKYQNPHSKSWIYYAIVAAISDQQYDFRSAKFTSDDLTVLSERVYRYLSAWSETRVIAFDISKAFDKVWHHKLKSNGISGTFLNLIGSFLTGRCIAVIPVSHSPSSYSINSGVSQWSVIGLSLILIFINDYLLYLFTYLLRICLTWSK